VISPFTVSFHDQLPGPKDPIRITVGVFSVADMAIEIGDLRIFMTADRARELRDAISGAIDELAAKTGVTA